MLRHGQLVIGMMDPLASPQAAQSVAATGASAIALELVPRISRAQSMDVLSSMATLSGYKSVLMGASASPRIFPMLMTAAGTLQPARVLIMGVGVAGLQACATAKRLGAVVEAEKESFEPMTPLDSWCIDELYALVIKAFPFRELTKEEFEEQAALEKEIANSDVVISTAAIPGKPAPKIIRAEAVRAMKPGAVIIDLAAETGGNCELTQAGKTIIENKVKIVGPINLAASLGKHASEMYSRNLFNFIAPAINDGELKIDWEDEVFSLSNLTRDGKIIHASSKEAIEGGSK